MSYTPKSKRQKELERRIENVIALSFGLEEKKVTAYIRDKPMETLKPVVRVLSRDEIILRKSDAPPTFDVEPNRSVYLLFKESVTLAYDRDSKEVQIFP